LGHKWKVIRRISSLSGFCAWVCFRRIASATCAEDLPLETAVNRSDPMACGPNVDQAGPLSGPRGCPWAALV
jgi:hypothetical protein